MLWFGLILVLLIIGVALYIYFVIGPQSLCDSKDGNCVPVTNFEECIEAGNPIMESYPRQCRNNDQLFVEEINVSNNNDKNSNFIEKELEDTDKEEQLESRDSMQARIATIKSWFEENIGTYKFDGSNLSFKDFEESSDCKKVDGCEVMVFQFNSSHAGYGDRGDSVLAQVITTHVTVLKVKNGQVIEAITDKKFDELGE